MRRYVYHDADNLDTAFDAGGKVSIGLTATTIVSQWTWSATLLQSSTVASKYGISGPYWYAGGATIQIILFAILSIMLKTRAPGAKTFLQVSQLPIFLNCCRRIAAPANDKERMNDKLEAGRRNDLEKMLMGEHDSSTRDGNFCIAPDKKCN